MKLDDWLPDESPAQSNNGCWGDVKRVASDARRRGLGRMALDLALEVALVFTVLKVYNIVRNQFGSVVVAPAVAHAHALQVIGLEKMLGFFVEQKIQGFFLQWPSFVRFWNVYYWAAHSSNTIGALLALFFIRPALYQRARTALLLMNCIAIVGYAGFPLMPPRLVPDCETHYGGCDADYHFVDTMDTLGGIWSWRGSTMEKVSNHYAAMPSMHFGYALWVCTALAGLLRGGPLHPRSAWGQRAVLAVVALYPASVLFCIVVTANHFLLDAMCGATVVGISYFVANFVPHFGRGAALDWGVALHWITGPNSSVVVAAEQVPHSREPGNAEGLPLLSQGSGPPKLGHTSPAAGGSSSLLQDVVVARDEAVILDGGRQHSASQPGFLSMERKSSAVSGNGGSSAARSVQMVKQARD